MTIDAGTQSTGDIANAINNAVEITSSSLDLPAWVQAIGSIIAILAAIGVAWWETHRQRIERDAEKDDNQRREVGERARFLNMASRQLDLALDVADGIAAEEQRFSHNAKETPGLSWESWAKVRAERFKTGVVDRLSPLFALPLTAWPDVEAGILFGEGVRRMLEEAKELRERVFDKKIIEPQRQRSHYTWAINVVTEWSEFAIHDFAGFIHVRNHAVERAQVLKIDLRYGERNVIDREIKTREAERLAKVLPGDPRSAMHSEIDMLRALRETIRPTDTEKPAP